MTRAFCFSCALALLIRSAVGAAAEDAPRFTGQVVPQVAHTQEVLEPAVKAAVVGATGNLQHPNIDRENPLVDFRLPVLK